MITLEILLNFIRISFPVLTVGVISVSVGAMIGYFSNRTRFKVLDSHLELLYKRIEDCHK